MLNFGLIVFAAAALVNELPPDEGIIGPVRIEIIEDLDVIMLGGVRDVRRMPGGGDLIVEEVDRGIPPEVLLRMLRVSQGDGNKPGGPGG